MRGEIGGFKEMLVSARYNGFGILQRPMTSCSAVDQGKSKVNGQKCLEQIPEVTRHGSCL